MIFPNTKKEIIAFVIGFLILTAMFHIEHPAHPFTDKVLAGFGLTCVIWLIATGLAYAEYSIRNRGGEA